MHSVKIHDFIIQENQINCLVFWLYGEKKIPCLKKKYLAVSNIEKHSKIYKEELLSQK